MLPFNRLDISLALLFISTLGLGALAPAPAQAQTPQWPLNRTIDLSSGFGDFRDGHFHAGLDLRTGGRIGAEVLAPVSGYVWRVKMSYRGYGKGLYFKGDDGFLYVFGHLARLADPIRERVIAAQVADRRYYQDVSFDENEIRFDKGDFIAFSGETGAGAPHLHFEKRTYDDNVPINPLRHGFKLDDKIAPTLARIGFQMTDENSLFDNGRRKLFFELPSRSPDGRYHFDTLLCFNRPFGVLLDGFDQMRAGGMQQAVWQYRVYLDEQLIYTCRYDSLDFETTISVLQEYDYVEANQGRKRTRRLFGSPGNIYPGSGGEGGGRGIIGDDIPVSVGRHQLRIVGEDCGGNQAELAADFIWGPSAVFELVSSEEIAADTAEFYLQRTPESDGLMFDSVLVLMNARGTWGEPDNLRVRYSDDGTLYVRAVGYSTERAVLRVFAFVDNGVIADVIFNGLLDSAPDRCRIYHEVVEDGLLVHVEALVINGTLGHIRLFDGERQLGIENLTYLDMRRHVCLVPPRPEYERITRIGACMNRDTTSELHAVATADTLAIYQVGQRGHQFIDYNGDFFVVIEAEDFHQPRFIEIRSSQPNRVALSLNSDHYQILPEAFEYRDAFRIGVRKLTSKLNSWVSGLCWLDLEDNRWIWLDNDERGDTLWAPSHGGGSFAAVFDNEPPELRRLSIFDGATYRDPNKKIGFQIVDTLSGIGDDRNIIVKLDGQWLPVEYDFETGICQTWPLEPMTRGQHHLGIVVTDRAGLRTEQYLNFTVRP